MIKFIIFIVLLCGFHSYKFVGGVVDDTEAQDAFERVDNEDRGYFITMHLALGYNYFGKHALAKGEFGIDLPEDVHIPFDVFNELKQLEVPSDFDRELYEWTKHEFNFTDHNIYELITRSVLCFPTGCVEAGDVGTLCCPF